MLPRNLAARAVARLELQAGDTVLEVGCGTGRNLRTLAAAVGPAGQVIEVDCSDGMLAKASARVERYELRNVRLLAADAAELDLPLPVDGVLFSLSYSVIPKPLPVLAKTWTFLRSGRHVVIMDGKAPRGVLGRLSRSFVNTVSKATVLGNLERQPWEDLKAFTPRIDLEEVNWGTYYICRGTKP